MSERPSSPEGRTHRYPEVLVVDTLLGQPTSRELGAVRVEDRLTNTVSQFLSLDDNDFSNLPKRLQANISPDQGWIKRVISKARGGQVPGPLKTKDLPLIAVAALQQEADFLNNTVLGGANTLPTEQLSERLDELLKEGKISADDFNQIRKTRAIAEAAIGTYFLENGVGSALEYRIERLQREPHYSIDLATRQTLYSSQAEQGEVNQSIEPLLAAREQARRDRNQNQFDSLNRQIAALRAPLEEQNNWANRKLQQFAYPELKRLLSVFPGEVVNRLIYEGKLNIGLIRSLPEIRLYDHVYDPVDVIHLFNAPFKLVDGLTTPSQTRMPSLLPQRGLSRLVRRLEFSGWTPGNRNQLRPIVPGLRNDYGRFLHNLALDSENQNLNNSSRLSKFDLINGRTINWDNIANGKYPQRSSATISDLQAEAAHREAERAVERANRPVAPTAPVTARPAEAAPPPGAPANNEVAQPAVANAERPHVELESYELPIEKDIASWLMRRSRGARGNSPFNNDSFSFSGDDMQIFDRLGFDQDRRNSMTVAQLALEFYKSLEPAQPNTPEEWIDGSLLSEAERRVLDMFPAEGIDENQFDDIASVVGRDHERDEAMSSLLQRKAIYQDQDRFMRADAEATLIREVRTLVSRGDEYEARDQVDIFNRYDTREPEVRQALSIRIRRIMASGR